MRRTIGLSLNASHLNLLFLLLLVLGARTTTISASPLKLVGFDKGQRANLSHLYEFGIAVCCFIQDKGHPPKDLSELTPHYLKSLPQCPFPGKSYRWQTTGQSFEILCLGDDGNINSKLLSLFYKSGEPARVFDGKMMEVKVRVNGNNYDLGEIKNWLQATKEPRKGS
jgi:hypothetical protein